MHSTSHPVHYSISLDSEAAHTLAVTLTIATPDPEGQVLSLPAWIPGSYMVRDFARNITRFNAVTANGAPLGVQLLDKQTWKLAPQNGPITVTYHLYAYDLSIRSAYICDEYAFFNGTSVYLKVHGQEDTLCGVTLEAPKQKTLSDWRVSTAMENSQGTSLYGFGNYQADNYDELIDHPVILGDFDLITFTESGVDFELVFAGGHNADTDRIKRDLAKICRHHIALFDDTPPVSRYVFMTLLSHNGFGGLEHRDSTALLYSRNDLPTINQKDEMTDGYRTFLSLCSHELFHTWHVKRIRPEELKVATLEEEVYTEQLWIYEGFTSYYDDISLVRCGLIDEASYLELMGQNLTRLLRNQGRLKQTVTESSFYAWTKFYKQDASAINNIVSYYNKGAVIAMNLDLLIKQQSKGEKSLDDVMRALWRKFGKTDIGTTPSVIHDILSEMSLDLDEFLNTALYTTDPLPTKQLLSDFGVTRHMRSRTDHKDRGGKDAKAKAKNAFGAVFKSAATGVEITQISDGSPAMLSGLQIGDQLLSIGHYQVTLDNLQNRIDLENVGSKTSLHFLRDFKLKEASMEVKEAPEDTVYLEISDALKLENWFVKPE